MAGGPWEDFAPSGGDEPWRQFDIGAVPSKASAPAAPGFVPTIKRTGGQMLTTLATSVDDITGANRVTGAIRDTGQGLIDRNPAGVNSLGDIASSPWLATKEALGQFVPQIGAAAAGGLAGAKAGQKIGGARGAAVGGIAGSLAPIFTQEYGGIRQDQIEGGQESIPRALAAATGATALERVGLGKTLKFLKSPGSIDISTIPREIAKGVAKEGLTEAAQTSVEQIGAFKDPTTRESIDEALFSGAMGGIGGGIVGGGQAAVSRAVRGAPPEQAPPAATPPPDQPPAAPVSGSPTEPPTVPPAAPLAPVVPPSVPPAAAGDPIRATVLPESGPLARGVNLLIEGEAQAADAGLPVPTPVAAALAGVPGEDAPHPDTKIPAQAAAPGQAKTPTTPAAGPLEAIAPQGGTDKPTFDPATGEIARPQRATWPTREAAQQYLTQQRVNGAGRMGKAVPVELSSGGFSFIREGEPGYEEAAAAVPASKMASEAKPKTEAKPAPKKKPSKLQERRAKAKEAKPAPTIAPAPQNAQPEGRSVAPEGKAAAAVDFQPGEKITGIGANGAELAGKFAGFASDGRVKLKQPGGNTHYVPAASVQRTDAPAAAPTPEPAVNGGAPAEVPESDLAAKRQVASPPVKVSAPPQQRTVSINGKDVTLSDEQAKKWDAADADAEASRAKARRDYAASKNDKGSDDPDVGARSASERLGIELKAIGMRLSAQRRKIADALTSKERQAADVEASRIRPGDIVRVEARGDGKVLKSVFGRVTVQFADGEPVTLKHAEVKKIQSSEATPVKSSLRERREKAIAERKAQSAAPQPEKGTSDETQSSALRPDAQAANADEGNVQATQEEVAPKTLAQRRAKAAAQRNADPLSQAPAEQAPVKGKAHAVEQAPKKAGAAAKARRALNAETDTLLQALAKLGGIQREVMAKEFGLKPEELKHTVSVGGLKGFPFRAKNGRDLDSAMTALREAGYFAGVADEDVRTKFEEAVYKELGGGQELTPQGQMADAARQQEEARLDADEAIEREALLSDLELSSAEVRAMDDDDIDFDAPSNASTEDAMRALGFTDQEIQDELAKTNGPAQAGTAETRQGATGETGTPARAGGEEARAVPAEGEGLTPEAPARSSFDRQIENLRSVAARNGWVIAENPGTDQIILKRLDASDGMVQRFTQLQASRVTSGNYQIEVSRGERKAKRGVNALNLEGEAVEYHDQRLLNWDNKRSWASNEMFPVLRDYVSNNPGEVLQAGAAPLLTSQTPADLKSKTDREAAATAADKAEQKRLADKAAGDAQRGEFTLTGSDRPADVAAAAGQKGLFAEQERKVYAVNEPGATNDIPLDLFPETVQADTGEGARRKPARAAARDVPAPTTLAVRQDPHFPGIYHFSTQLVEVGRRELPVAKVTNWTEAASALAAMNRYAVEHFDALVTDKNGKPLAIIGSFKGAQTQTSVYPSTLLAEALRIEGATRIWGVHNHPSGTENLSSADHHLNGVLHKTFDPSSVEWMGLAAIGGERFSAVEGNGVRGSLVSGTIITGATKATIPVVERTITPGNLGMPALTSPAEVKRILSTGMTKREPGILFMNSQNAPTAWVPVNPLDVATLRQGGRFDKLINSASQAGAGSAIIANPGGVMNQKILNNIASALGLIDVRTLDSIDTVTMESAAEKGSDPRAGFPILDLADENQPYPIPLPTVLHEGPVPLADRVMVGRMEKAFRKGGMPDLSLTALPRVLEPAQDAHAEVRKRYAAADLAQKLFGRRIVWFHSNRMFAHGMVVNEAPNVLFINENTTRPIMSVMGHELTHSMKLTNPELYAKLEARIMALTKNPDAADREGLNLRRIAAGMPELNTEKLREEFVANVVGDNFSNPEFWRRLAADQPSTFQKILQAVLDWIDGVLSKLKNDRPYGTWAHLQDIDGARNAVVEVMREFAKSNGLPAPAVAASEVSLSLADKKLLPRGAVATVYLKNNHHNLYERYADSGPVLLTNDGRIRMDGLLLAPGDVVYAMPDNTFVNEVPQAERDRMAADGAAAIANMIQLSSEINRSVAKTPIIKPRPANESMEDFMALLGEDDGRMSWEAARYPKARTGWSSDIRRYESVDKISEKHDPDALKNAYVQQELDKHQKFVVGGFLHVDDAQEASPDVMQAIKAWSKRGGRLGKSALDLGNSDPTSPDISLDLADQPGKAISKQTVTDLTKRAGNKLADYRGLALQALGRLQLVNLYAKDIPALTHYSGLVQQMDADVNGAGAEADALATAWGNLKDEQKLAEVMHDATLHGSDPTKPFSDAVRPGRPVPSALQHGRLTSQYNALSPEAKKVFTDARDQYATHWAAVQKEMTARVERSMGASPGRAELLAKMAAAFKGSEGIYFPLARFGDYVIVAKDAEGAVLMATRAETLNEAAVRRAEMVKHFADKPGVTVSKVFKSKEFNANRDMVSKGFLKELFDTLEKQDVPADVFDSINQLYLASLPDLSWAKHGIHRKGTPGFSQDARRAFAMHMFHGARYLSKLRYSDQLAAGLETMQEQVDAKRDDEKYDSVKAQQVVDEMVKRHDNLMNPKSNALSTLLTSFGFMFHLGLSPASALVNLTQTAFVAYPLMGAKWGFGKASAALMQASRQTASNRNDISKTLKGDELRAFEEAVRSGTIDVTQAHDLAGLASGEDAKLHWKLRPVMRAASFMFHHAEKFNRQVTFVAAYRLARAAGAVHEDAYAQAVQATYDGHFNYSASNRPRVMQGNAAKVLLLFKQYSQNMIYTLGRQAALSLAKMPSKERTEARKALSGLLVMHAAGAGVLGLPMVTTLLALASFLGGDDDEPWDAQVALRNMLADTFGQAAGEALSHGLTRLTPFDISGRVGLDRLIFPDVQEGLEGARWAESFMAGMLGPVAGIATNWVKAGNDIAMGHWGRALEGAAPAALRGPLKSYRYYTEGAIDKSGVPIKADVSAAGTVGQFFGLAPSDVREATEARGAIYQADKRLMERRQTLLTQFSSATLAGDREGQAEARAAIQAYNQKNPARAIRPENMVQSVRTRQKRIAGAQEGVALPVRRRDAMEAGRFGAQGQ